MRRMLESRMEKEKGAARSLMWNLCFALFGSITKNAYKIRLDEMSMEELQELATKADAFAQTVRRYQHLRELYY